MINLYLMRHGEAVSTDVDPEAPLTKLGRVYAERMAAFLECADVRVDYIWHSDRLRAKQTAEIIAPAVLEQGKPDFLEGLGSLDPVDAIIEQWGDWDGPTLLVGHLPFMNRLVAKMVNGDEEKTLLHFQTGSVVCLECSESVWKLGWMLRPHLIKTQV